MWQCPCQTSFENGPLRPIDGVEDSLAFSCFHFEERAYLARNRKFSMQLPNFTLHVQALTCPPALLLPSERYCKAQPAPQRFLSPCSSTGQLTLTAWSRSSHCQPSTLFELLNLLNHFISFLNNLYSCKSGSINSLSSITIVKLHNPQALLHLLRHYHPECPLLHARMRQVSGSPIWI